MKNICHIKKYLISRKNWAGKCQKDNVSYGIKIHLTLLGDAGRKEKRVQIGLATCLREPSLSVYILV